MPSKKSDQKGDKKGDKQVEPGTVKTIPCVKYDIYGDTTIKILKRKVRSALAKKFLSTVTSLQEDICIARSTDVVKLIKEKKYELPVWQSTNVAFPGCEVRHVNLAIKKEQGLSKIHREPTYIVNMKFEDIHQNPEFAVKQIMEYLSQHYMSCKAYFITKDLKPQKPQIDDKNKQYALTFWFLQALYHEIFKEIPMKLGAPSDLGAAFIIKSNGKVKTVTKTFENITVENKRNNETHVCSGKFIVEYHEKPHYSITEQTEEDLFLVDKSKEILNQCVEQLQSHVFVFKIQYTDYRVHVENKTNPVKYENSTIEHILEIGPYHKDFQESVEYSSGDITPKHVSKATKEITTKQKTQMKVCRVWTEDECTNMLVHKYCENHLQDAPTLEIEKKSTLKLEWKKRWEESNVLVEFFSNVGYMFCSLTIQKPHPVVIAILVKYTGLNTFFAPPKSYEDEKFPGVQFRPKNHVKTREEGNILYVRYNERLFLNRYFKSDAGDFYDLQIRSMRDLKESPNNSNFVFKEFEAHGPARSFTGCQMLETRGKGGDVLDPSSAYSALVIPKPNKKGKNKPAKLVLTLGDIPEDCSVVEEKKASGLSVKQIIRLNKPKANKNANKLTEVEDTRQSGNEYNAWKNVYEFFNIQRMQCQIQVSKYMEDQKFPSYGSLRKYIGFTLQGKSVCEKGNFRAYLHRFSDAQEEWQELCKQLVDDLEKKYIEEYSGYRFIEDPAHKDAVGDFYSFREHCMCEKKAREYPSLFVFWYRDFAAPMLAKILEDKMPLLAKIQRKNADVSREIVACAMVIQKMYEHFPNNDDAFVQFCCGVLQSTIFKNPYISPKFFQYFLSKMHGFLTAPNVDIVSAVKDASKMNMYIFMIKDKIMREFDDFNIEYLEPKRGHVNKELVYHDYIQFQNLVLFDPWELDVTKIGFNCDAMILNNNKFADRSQNLELVTTMTVLDEEDNGIITVSHVEKNLDVVHLPQQLSSNDDTLANVEPQASTVVRAVPSTVVHTVPKTISMEEVRLFMELYRPDINMILEYIQPYTVNLAPDIYKPNQVNTPVYVYWSDQKYYINVNRKINGNLFEAKMPFDLYSPDIYETYSERDIQWMQVHGNEWLESKDDARQLFDEICSQYPNQKHAAFEIYKWFQGTQSNAWVLAVMAWGCLVSLTQTLLGPKHLENPAFKELFVCLEGIPAQDCWVSKWHVHRYCLDFVTYLSGVNTATTYYVLAPNRVPLTGITTKKLEIILSHIQPFYVIYYYKDKAGILLENYEMVKLPRVVRKYRTVINYIKVILMHELHYNEVNPSNRPVLMNKFFFKICSQFVRNIILCTGAEANTIRTELCHIFNIMTQCLDQQCNMNTAMQKVLDYLKTLFQVNVGASVVDINMAFLEQKLQECVK